MGRSQKFMSSSSSLMCNAIPILVLILFHDLTSATLDIQLLLSQQVSLFSQLPHLEIYYAWRLAITAICPISDEDRLFFSQIFEAFSHGVALGNAKQKWKNVGSGVISIQAKILLDVMSF
jgi:hypothetical protein